MNRNDYRIKNLGEVLYKPREGDLVTVTNLKDPRIVFRGYLEEVTPVQVTINHENDDGTSSLITFANEPGYVIGQTSEKEHEEIEEFRRQVRIKKDRMQRTAKRVKLQII